jgi:hypothetical protein
MFRYTGMLQRIGLSGRCASRLVMIWEVKATLVVTGVPGLVQQLYVLDAAAAPGRPS